MLVLREAYRLISCALLMPFMQCTRAKTTTFGRFDGRKPLRLDGCTTKYFNSIPGADPKKHQNEKLVLL